jgi:hypothetical protein
VIGTKTTMFCEQEEEKEKGNKQPSTPFVASRF